MLKHPLDCPRSPVARRFRPCNLFGGVQTDTDAVWIAGQLLSKLEHLLLWADPIQPVKNIGRQVKRVDRVAFNAALKVFDPNQANPAFPADSKLGKQSGKGAKLILRLALQAEILV